MSWANLIVLAVLSAGHAALVVAVINRLYAFAFPCWVLKVIGAVHDVLIPAFPVVLLWWVGFGEHGLLWGGSWSTLHPALLGYLALCAASALLVPITSAVRHLRPLPEAQISNHSHTVDVAGVLGYRPLGAGPCQMLARFPGNEQFLVEVSEKVYRLPRVPKALDGLSILHLTDLHYTGTIDRPYFEKAFELGAQMNPDLIALTGDLLDEPQRVDWLAATLGKLHAPLGCYFVLGNHDREVDTDDLRRRLADLGWQDVAGRALLRNVDGHPLVIAGSERPWMGAQPNLDGTPADAFRLLLSHSPDTLAWARRNGIDLMLAGHNHGGQVRLPLLGPLYSPSLHGCRYASGAFWEEPTLLYVSRGLSSRHPIRYRCKPEVTEIVLRADASNPPG